MKRLFFIAFMAFTLTSCLTVKPEKSTAQDYIDWVGSSVSLPTVTTNAVTSIAYATATCGGNVTNDGGDPSVTRGVCWNTTGTPTITDTNTSDGSGEGTFTSSITGTSCDHTYYVRAYATNSAGTSYGVEQSYCLRPCDLISVSAFTTITIDGVTTSCTTEATSAQACYDYYNPAGRTISLGGSSHRVVSLTVGELLYYQSGVQCNTMSPGYYFKGAHQIIHISGGIITEIISCP